MRIRKKERLPEAVQLQEIEEKHKLSQQIFFRREALGLTQDELARRAGLTQAQIANLEAGHANPTLLTVVKVAGSLCCDLAALFESEDAVRDTTDVSARHGGWVLAHDREPMISIIVPYGSQEPPQLGSEWSMLAGARFISASEDPVFEPRKPERACA